MSTSWIEKPYFFEEAGLQEHYLEGIPNHFSILIREDIEAGEHFVEGSTLLKRLVVYHKFNVNAQKLREQSSFFGEAFKPTSIDGLKTKPLARNFDPKISDLVLRRLHDLKLPENLEDFNHFDLRKIIWLCQKFGIRAEILTDWFDGWFSHYRDNLYGNEDDIWANRHTRFFDLLRAGIHFNHPVALRRVSKDIVYKFSSHIYEPGTKDIPKDLRIPYHFIDALNAAQSSTRNNLQGLVLSIDEEYLPLPCGCSATLVFGFTKELHRLQLLKTSQWRSFMKKYSLNELMKYLAKYNWEPYSKTICVHDEAHNIGGKNSRRKKNKSKNKNKNEQKETQDTDHSYFEQGVMTIKEKLQEAVAWISSDFEGLCWDCCFHPNREKWRGNPKGSKEWKEILRVEDEILKGERERVKDTMDQVNEGQIRDDIWCRGCRIKHREPTWYFSHMARKEYRRYIH